MDDWAVGDRIRKRHSEFDEVGSSVFQREYEMEGVIGCGIASGEISDEGFAALGFAIGEQVAYASCGLDSHRLLIKLRHILAVDIYVFIAAARDVYDIDLILIERGAPDSLGYGM